MQAFLFICKESTEIPVVSCENKCVCAMVEQILNLYTSLSIGSIGISPSSVLFAVLVVL